ncbi:SMN complex subunit [Sphaerulina musiva]
MADENLTHDELWDDSALVTSWNDAFNEYKKYHSLASRGEKVEQPKQPPTESLKEVAVESKAAAYLNGTTATTTQPSSNAPINFATEATPTATTTTATPHTTAGPILPNLPQTLLNGSQNEDLKNIMMSWYYAGYYTGLYEGQQKAWASIQEQQLAQQQGEQ